MYNDDPLTLPSRLPSDNAPYVTRTCWAQAGTALLGCALGLVLLTHGHRLRAISAVIGVVSLSCFLLVRELGGFGNLLKPPSHDPIDMLNVIKYPPSIAFTLLTLGILFCVIAIFITLSTLETEPYTHWLWRPLQVYGGTALCYYLVHLWLISLFGLIFNPKGT